MVSFVAALCATVAGSAVADAPGASTAPSESAGATLGAPVAEAVPEAPVATEPVATEPVPVPDPATEPPPEQVADEPAAEEPAPDDAPADQTTADETGASETGAAQAESAGRENVEDKNGEDENGEDENGEDENGDDENGDRDDENGDRDDENGDRDDDENGDRDDDENGDRDDDENGDFDDRVHLGLPTLDDVLATFGTPPSGPCDDVVAQLVALSFDTTLLKGRISRLATIAGREELLTKRAEIVSRFENLIDAASADAATCNRLRGQLPELSRLTSRLTESVAAVEEAERETPNAFDDNIKVMDKAIDAADRLNVALDAALGIGVEQEPLF